MAARTNLMPGLLLQALMLGFLALYLWSDDTRGLLGGIARFKQEVGYPFAFVSYLIAAALLPELLRIAFFQHGRFTRANLWNFLTVAPFWGCMGMIVDGFYRLQLAWFGGGSDLRTVLLKMAVDQLLFSPFFAAPLVIGYLHWRDSRFRIESLRGIVTLEFFFGRVFPLIVAGWCIWIPGVSLVYFMPSPLQIPVAVLIQVFWVLIITTLAERSVNVPDDTTVQPLT
ncbi:MAG: hypothetical protein PHC88_02615 [Terrimicrobiaceae bacterium]|nr:hypothetical protein [Terrimicrobiaceae bacterium]